MRKKRGLALDDKRNAVDHTHKELFNLKEIESLASKLVCDHWVTGVITI